ncbi:MAG TPA: hypothetical protein VJ343_01890 [archaeon]|nr:hypothetical protein [archaeon]
MPKALATNTLFLVVVIGMMIFFSLIVFWQWVKLENVQLSREACAIKFANYCERWAVCNYRDCKPNDWETTNPKIGCEEFEITEPNADKCKQTFPLPGD